MGNCLVLQNKDSNIFRADCKVLEYKVHHILSKFRGHAAAYDTVPSVENLHLDADRSSDKHPLLPLLVPPKDAAKKTVRFSRAVVPAEEMTGVVRIKLVISKKELKELLQKGGIIVDDKVLELQKNTETDEVDVLDNKTSCMGWKPTLESIPEEK